MKIQYEAKINNKPTGYLRIVCDCTHEVAGHKEDSIVRCYYCGKSYNKNLIIRGEIGIDKK